MHLSQIETNPSSSLPAGTKRRVFVVEDHPIFRHGLVQLLVSDPSLEVCGEASSAPEALARLRNVPADLIVLDLALAGSNGIELIKSIRAEHERIPILMLSMYDEAVYAMRALRAGANGYLMKREDPDVFLQSVHRVLGGEIAVSHSFSEQLIYRVIHGGQLGEATPINTLTDRELEILSLVGHGRSSRQIAEDLHLSTKTVESHRLHIKEKLGLGNAAELLRFATAWVQQEEALT
jgi:DNA-binding NarL/FixJ family response regulator